MTKKGLIIKALSGFYYVRTSDGQVYQTRPRGVFRHQAQTPLVGDQVIFEADHQEEGTILEIVERKNYLTRPPVANIDVGVIVASMVTPDLSTQLLDRFLVVLASHHIEPVIYISKYDLVDEKARAQLIDLQKIYEAIGYHFIVVGGKDEVDFTEQVQNAFAKELEGRILVFMGQSGAGKSTLLNYLDPSLDLKTGETSKALGRGKHTTRHVELIPLYGGWFADTPGFSTVDFADLSESDLSACFPEIWAERVNCKFNTCLHQNEPKCGVKQAVQAGRIAEFRYNHYLAFLEEIQNKKPIYNR